MLLVAGLLGLAGCAGPVADGGAPPTPSPRRVPAAVAGGACRFLDYDVIEKMIGARFDVAAAGETSDSFTCVLQSLSGSLPDLSLSITQTKADPSVFKDTVVPDDADSVSDLGKVGYSAAVPAKSGAGPGVEVGWLSGDRQVVVLRYRSPKGTATDDVAKLTDKLVDLAKTIDRKMV